METRKDNTRKLFATGFKPERKGWRYIRYAHALLTVVLASAVAACCTGDLTSVSNELKPLFAVTVSTKYNLTYPGAGGTEQTYDAWRASNTPTTNAAVIVFVPGGGWSKCGKDSDVSNFYLPKLPKKGPWVVYSVCYATGYGIWPAQENDLQAFVHYIRANATTLGINPNQIFGLGHSAGAHLVALNDSLFKAIATLSAPSYLIKLADSTFNADAQQFIPLVFGDSAARFNASPALVPGACVPRYVFHGADDMSVKPINGRLLAAACAGARYWECPTGGHSLLQTLCKTAVLDSAVTHFKRNMQ